eukprot:GHVH01000116.1.p1 GENE.GHVH01000116.1~~GHVH01000116.1.p1  ORF type:complete len:587 (-),score=74.70 GHVH01000116.1:154-1914(-)
MEAVIDESPLLDEQEGIENLENQIPLQQFSKSIDDSHVKKNNRPKRRDCPPRSKQQTTRKFAIDEFDTNKQTDTRRGGQIQTSVKRTPHQISRQLAPRQDQMKGLADHEDPKLVLWKAITLDMDSTNDVSLDDLLNHDRLYGTILASVDGRSRLDVIQAAAAIGVPFDKVKDDGCNWNIIHTAVSCDSLPMLTEVLSHIADDQMKLLINEFSALLGTTKWTPLLIAVKNGFSQAVPLLLARGADSLLPLHLITADTVDRKSGKITNSKEGVVAPIFFAVKTCPVETVQTIYENMQKAIHSYTENGQTVPDGSVICGDGSISQIQDSKGRTAVHYLSERPLASSGSTIEIMDYLLSLDHDLISICDNFGNLPLHECCKRNNDDMALNFIHVLKTCGVDVGSAYLQKNKDDITPLIIAVVLGMKSTVSMMLQSCKQDFANSNVPDMIMAALHKGSLMLATNIVVCNTTVLEDAERVSLKFIANITLESDQSQLIRAIKRLGSWYCMQFFATFTEYNNGTDTRHKIRRDNNEPRSNGGVFLTMLKENLFKEGRFEDWSYIRAVTDLGQKKMKGKYHKKMTKNELLESIK